MASAALAQSGVAKSWQTRTKVIRALRAVKPARPMEMVRAYNSRQDSGNQLRSIPLAEYFSVGAKRQIHAIASALEGNDAWKAELAEAVRYNLFAYRLDYFWHEQFRVVLPNHPQPLKMLSWEQMTNTMAFAFLLDWTDDATYQGYLTHAALNRSFQLVQQYEQEHRRAHAFMLRLFADWRADGTGHEWPQWAKEVPIYETILSGWKTTDIKQLEQWLLSACDRHTHETGRDTATTFFDFGDEILIRTPLEILLVLRVRALLGLENPTLAHPLMEAPFDKLPGRQAVPADDLWMTGTSARATHDWPQLQTVTSLEQVRGWARA